MWRLRLVKPQFVAACRYWPTMWQRRFDDSIVLTDGISEARGETRGGRYRCTLLGCSPRWHATCLPQA
jgi:hypothetical protein